jgi:hypothetical protein
MAYGRVQAIVKSVWTLGNIMQLQALNVSIEENGIEADSQLTVAIIATDNNLADNTH